MVEYAVASTCIPTLKEIYLGDDLYDQKHGVNTKY